MSFGSRKAPIRHLCWCLRTTVAVVLVAGLLALLGPATQPAGAGWVLPSSTISPASSTTYNPKAGIGPGGATTVVWQLDDNFDDIIQATTRPGATGQFGNPVTVFQSNLINNIIPEIAIGPGGATEVVWTGQSGSYSNASYSGRAGSSGAFSSPALAMELGLNDELPYPDVAAGPGGQVTVVWVGSSGANSLVHARVKPGAGEPFSAKEDLSALGGDALYPKVATAPNGDTTAVWQRWNGSGYTVQAATRPAGAAAFLAPEDLSDPGLNARYPQVGFARDGRTTVVWQVLEASQGDLQAATRAPGANSFGEPVDIATPGSASEPDLAIGPNGDVTVVWAELVGADWLVQSATRRSGAGSFDLRDIAVPEISGSAPQITTGADGTTVVTWRSPNQVGNGIKAATRRPVDSDFSAPINLSPADVDAGIARLASGPEGTIVAVWSSVDGLVRQATRLADPRLGKLAVTGPGKAKRSKPSTFRVRIRNVGYGSARSVVVRAKGIGARATRKVGSLPGRSSKSVKVPLKFTKRGKARVTFTLTSKNAGNKTMKKVVRVR